MASGYYLWLVIHKAKLFFALSLRTVTPRMILQVFFFCEYPTSISHVRRVCGGYTLWTSALTLGLAPRQSRGQREVLAWWAMAEPS